MFLADKLLFLQIRFGQIRDDYVQYNNADLIKKQNMRELEKKKRLLIESLKLYTYYAFYNMTDIPNRLCNDY